MEKELTEEARRVLEAVRERAADGYVVMTRAHVDSKVLATALAELQSRGAVSVKGDPSADCVGEACRLIHLSRPLWPNT